VLEGLREMKTRVAEFTEALEIGKDELQSELARRPGGPDPAGRADEPRALHPARRPPPAGAAGRARAAHDREDPSGPTAFRPPRLSPTPRLEPKPTPSLDPAWLLLEDEGDGLWSPPSEAAGPAEPMPRPATAPRAAAPMGVSAGRALAARPGAAALLGESDDPRERRRRIVEMARNGRTIDDISRELHVGRGEVTLALSRAR
jgi:hypothetical protein